MNNKTFIDTRSVTINLPVITYRLLLETKENYDLIGKNLSLREIIVDALTKYCEENKNI